MMERNRMTNKYATDGEKLIAEILIKILESSYSIDKKLEKLMGDDDEDLPEETQKWLDEVLGRKNKDK